MNPRKVLTKRQRILLGSVILLLVELFWVLSSDLTIILYKYEEYQKPYFCTYLKTSMFTVFLLGFLLYPPWKKNYCSKPTEYIFLEADTEDEGNLEDNSETKLSNPVYVPVKIPDKDYVDKSSENESDDATLRSVRFNKMAEVRQLSEAEARDALLARLSYHATLRAGKAIKKATAKVSVHEVSRTAFIFCLLVLLGNYAYQIALIKLDQSLLCIFFSTSSIFTLFLSGLYPSCQADKFTVSKLFAVVLNIMSILIMNVGRVTFDDQAPAGATLCLISAFFFSTYIVFLKKVTESRKKLNIVMFLGFVGAFSMLIGLPIIFTLHFTRFETFEWPTIEQFMMILLNILLDTIISEALWLWGRFLTSSLVAIMTKAMIIPMAMLLDAILRNNTYSYLFYLGIIPMIIAFLMIIMYLYFNNWDPLYGVMCILRGRLCRKSTSNSRVKEQTSEQLEALIGINNSVE